MPHTIRRLTRRLLAILQREMRFQPIQRDRLEAEPGSLARAGIVESRCSGKGTGLAMILGRYWNDTGMARLFYLRSKTPVERCSTNNVSNNGKSNKSDDDNNSSRSNRNKSNKDGDDYYFNKNNSRGTPALPGKEPLPGFVNGMEAGVQVATLHQLLQPSS
jgi:hypothetical protein